MMKNGLHKISEYCVLLTIFTVCCFAPLFMPASFAQAAPAPGCSASVSYTSEDPADPGLKEEDYNALMVGFDTSETKYNGSFYLDMGLQAIDPESIIIPFEQSVCVSFFYEDAGYTSSLGWMLADDAVFDGSGNLDWGNTPESAKHPIFEQVADGSGGGNGILDAYASETDESLRTMGFTPWEDGILTPKDMRKCLGTFGAGTELVFWLANGDGDWQNDDVFFTKPEWNPDTFTSCLSTFSSHDRTYLLGQPNAGGSCDTTSKGFLDAAAITRLSDEFSLTMSGSYVTTVTYDEQFDHVIVAAPDGDPNQWILSWEDLNGGGDMDYNDITFRIDRKNGGTLASIPKSATSVDATAFYTAVTLGIYDEIPACAGNRIDYFVSADNGVNWVEVANWDKVIAYTLEDDGTKTLGDPVIDWYYGVPITTYREARIDFLGLNLSGQELVWKAEMRSDVNDDLACMPRILGASLDGDTATPSDISRSSPIMVGNMLYSGSFRTPEVGWSEKRPRGYLRATEMYAPVNPSAANDPPVITWEGGSVLDGTSSAARDIYFPDVAAASVVSDPLTLTKPSDSSTATAGDGVATLYTGTLASAPVLATSVRVFAGTMEFRDEGAGSLTSNWGRGVINRFTGEFALEFDAAPLATDIFRAEYSYYTDLASQAMQALETTNARLSDSLLGLDGRLINGTDPVYDFNNDGLFNATDRQFLVDWVRGSGRDWKLGAIDHSVPAVVVPPSKSDWYYGTSTSADARSSFDSYVTGFADRDAALFVGSRDGMLHAFDAGPFRWGNNPATPAIEEVRGYFAWHDHDSDTDTPDVPNYGTGEELWSFIPANLLPRLKNNYLGRVSEEGDQAFVDASPTLADIRMDVDCPGCVSSDCVSGELIGVLGSEQCVGEWRTVLLSAQGNGGDSVVALDVTDPTDPRFLWEYADPELFRSRSSPAVGKVGRILVDGVEKWAAFFVSGKTYDTSVYPSIYLIDITDGSLIGRIYLDAVAEGVGAPSGLGGVPSGQPAIVDSDGNGYIDRLYIGTDKGLMYKVDFSDDPAVFWSDTRNVVINWDFFNDDATGTVNGQPNPVPDNQKWHPIYASPTVIVENGVNSDGTTAHNVRVFFGTGDNPYFDEDIDTVNTTYHFFSYVDQAPKGDVDQAQIGLDWFYPLDTGQRIFASAFASAGKIYFGTATSDTEDPCDGSNEGELYAFDVDGTNVDNPTRISTGDIVTTPLVEDEHLFVRTVTGTVMMGGGGFNNQTMVGGVGVTKPLSWREITD